MLLVYQGLVDIDKELAKLQSKREKLISQLEKLRKETQIPDYESKVLLFFVSTVAVLFNVPMLI